MKVKAKDYKPFHKGYCDSQDRCEGSIWVGKKVRYMTPRGVMLADVVAWDLRTPILDNIKPI